MKKNIKNIICLIVIASIFACTPKNEKLHKTKSNNQTNSSIENEAIYYVFTDEGFLELKLDREPKPMGGEKNFLKTMYMNIQYPAEARNKGIQGAVQIEVVINESGQMESAEIKKGIGGGCDEEALKVVKLAGKSGFEPAIKNGQAVKVKYDIPVKFKLA